jgi:hypothetical protein
VDIQIQIFLTSALVGGEWPASRPGKIKVGSFISKHGTAREENILARPLSPEMSEIFSKLVKNIYFLLSPFMKQISS